MKKGYILVEGKGELGSVDNLVSRLWHEAGHWQQWAPAMRWVNIHQERGIAQGVAYARSKDAGALLVLRDEDDACPKERGPEAAAWARALAPSFPVAIVLLHREYEVLFLPCLAQMAGQAIVGTDGRARPGFPSGTRYTGGWEAKRGVKEWLTEQLPRGRTYKPAVDQLPLTRMIDIPTLRAASVPCFGTLERALAFLAENFGGAGIYPPPQ